MKTQIHATKYKHTSEKPHNKLSQTDETGKSAVGKSQGKPNVCNLVMDQ